jgi:3-methyladenine DNA glycosylase AlkC
VERPYYDTATMAETLKSCFSAALVRRLAADIARVHPTFPAAAFVLFVAERGLDHFDLSMQAQYQLTKRFSAESSVRPHIARDLLLNGQATRVGSFQVTGPA